MAFEPYLATMIFNAIYCTIIQIKILIVSDDSATYKAAIIKDVLQ